MLPPHLDNPESRADARGETSPAKAQPGVSAAYLASSGVSRTYPAVSEQVECLPLDTSALPPFAYNPSIGRDGKKLWMTYRYHPEAGNPATRLGIAQLANGAAINPQDFALTGVSNEDARLFRFHGELSMSWVQSDFIGQARPKAIVKYGHLKTVFKGDTVPPELVIEKAQHIQAGGNDGGNVEKTGAFSRWTRIFSALRVFPEQVVFRVQGEAGHQRAQDARDILASRPDSRRGDRAP